MRGLSGRLAIKEKQHLNGLIDMNYEELKEALDYTAEHREEVLGENSAILSIVISQDKNVVESNINGDRTHIIAAIAMVAKENKMFATTIIAAAEMIKAEISRK